MAFKKLQVLEEKGYVELKPFDGEFDPAEWESLEYVDWKSGAIPISRSWPRREEPDLQEVDRIGRRRLRPGPGHQTKQVGRLRRGRPEPSQGRQQPAHRGRHRLGRPGLATAHRQPRQLHDPA